MTEEIFYNLRSLQPKYKIGDEVKLIDDDSRFLPSESYVIQKVQTMPNYGTMERQYYLDVHYCYLVEHSKMGLFWPREHELIWAKPCDCNNDNPWTPACFECMEKFYP